ncbi:E3 ubiquitin-protein ligase [Oopsacas minuta]|uniref:E3 ubiquitin-protein ligase n=1 Tax=Oopsacas minuta TaxID=111878 RepID=A0AAV7JER7_9METZ|nr:E3 ubiquitin-protein ligase [Oopsacas minuta]
MSNMSNYCPDKGCSFKTAIPAGLPVNATICPFCQKSLELAPISPVQEDNLVIDPQQGVEIFEGAKSEDISKSISESEESFVINEQPHLHVPTSTTPSETQLLKDNLLQNDNSSLISKPALSGEGSLPEKYSENNSPIPSSGNQGKPSDIENTFIIESQRDNKAQERNLALEENKATPAKNDSRGSESSDENPIPLSSDQQKNLVLEYRNTQENHLALDSDDENQIDQLAKQAKGESVKSKFKNFILRKPVPLFTNRKKKKGRSRQKRHPVNQIHFGLRSLMEGKTDIRIQFNTLILREYYEQIGEISLEIIDKNFVNFPSYFNSYDQPKEVEINGYEFNIFHGVLMFPTKCISDFPYKYCLHFKSGHEIYEHLHHDSDINFNRYFKWDDDAVNQICDNKYQKFDMMILPEIRKQGNSILFGPDNIVASSDREIQFSNIDDRLLSSFQALLQSYFLSDYFKHRTNLENLLEQFIYCVKSLSNFYLHDPDVNDLQRWDESNLTTKLVKAWIMEYYSSKTNATLDDQSIIAKFYLACCLINTYSIHSNSLNKLVIDMIGNSILTIFRNESYTLNEAISTNPEFRNKIQTALHEFVFKSVMLGKYPEKLLLVIPIYHMITNLKANAVSLHEKCRYMENEYWGFPVDVQLYSLEYISFHSEELQLAFTLVKYDKFLPYTIAIYTLNEGNAIDMCEYFIQSHECPLSALMSALLFRLMVSRSRPNPDISVKKDDKLITEVLKSLSMAFKGEPEFLVDDIYRLNNLTINLALKLSTDFNRKQFELCLTLISEAYEYCYTESGANATISSENISELFNEFVIKWYEFHIRKQEMSYEDLLFELDFWENLLSVYSFSQSIEWKINLRNFLKKRFTDTNILLEYLIKILTLQPTDNLMQEILINELFSRIVDLYSKDRIPIVKRLFHYFSENNQLQKLNIIFSQILLDEEKTFYQNINWHFVSWDLWDIYFSFLSLVNIDQILSKDAKIMLENARGQFSLFLDAITGHSITVGNLKQIDKNKDSFSVLISIFIQSVALSKNLDKLTHMELDVCLEMLKWFLEQMDMLRTLYRFTEKFDEINDENISKFLPLTFDGHEIRMLCSSGEKLQLSIISHPDITKIVNFEHFKSLCTISESIQESSVITEVFKDVSNGRGIQMDEFDISDFYNHVWLPAWDICILLVKNISNESILLSELSKYFKVTEKYEEIENELILLDSECEHYQNTPNQVKKSFKSSANKIHIYFTLLRRSQVATLICELKEKFSIKTNFESIEKLKNASDMYYNKKLSVMDAKVGELANDLGILSYNLEVIQAVIENIAFIRWVKENMIDLNEVKAFVDISLTACEGNPVETDRITCFSSVCSNFSPFIFGINENTSYETLITRCKQVIETVGKNEKLTVLLGQVGKNVTFWDEMKRSHGAIEETTLVELDNLMKSGVFILKVGDSSNLCDIVSLRVERENENEKFYSLEQLKEFRSKLMLVVSKNEQSGNRPGPNSYEKSQLFTLKFDKIIEIAKIVIQLTESDHQGYLKYLINLTEAETRLEEIHSKLSSILQVWRNSIEEARNAHYYLNYYTISQIALLQKGIKSFIDGGKDSDREQLYHLLSLLNFEVTKNELQQAFRKCDYTSEYLNQQPCLAESSSNFSKTEIQLAKSVKTDAGVELNIIKDAMLDMKRYQSSNILSKKSILYWYEKHKTQPNSSCRPFPDTESKFLQIKISCTNATQMKTSVDFNKLGSFLTEIFRSRTSKILAKRNLPSDLKYGTPNLVVIPSSEILEFVLSLYLCDNDKFPLPFCHEVLFCTDQTTNEEVEIFFRRALTEHEASVSYIFCMVNIENLKYDVAVESYTEFESLGNNRPRDCSYKLVLICSEENEGFSYLAAAFEGYKRSVLVLNETKEFTDTLNRRISSAYKNRRSYWLVDKEKSRVRIVASNSSGAGKSLYIRNLRSDMLSQGVVRVDEIEQAAVTVAIHGKQASEEHLAEQLLSRNICGVEHGVMFHVDIASTVQWGLEPMLFKLLVLGGISKSTGEFWHCRHKDYYVVEITLTSDQNALARFSQLFPNVQCVQPSDALGITANIGTQTIDLNELRSEQYQRVNAYLKLLEKGVDLDTFVFQPSVTYDRVDHIDCLNRSLKHCGIAQPSWSEVRNFTSFLNKQLTDCDNSDYCQSGVMGQEWKGFKSFVVRFMLHMSRDFATPSLMSYSELDPKDLTKFQVLNERRWENNTHPYIFFNPDGHTMTFLGFHITEQGHLLDSDNPSFVIENNIMHPNLFQILTRNRVMLQENYHQFDKLQKISKLVSVMNLSCLADPDPEYVLTLDNMRKILAILMRFHCNIPVVIMGETGCGKTRLIQFMCSLQALQTGATNMLILKVHGGTTEKDVMTKVEEAEALAMKNFREHDIDTVLFFDEANTSPAIGLIKEIMCDRRMYGRHISSDIRLQFIAACNPYRRHTKEMLNKLSTAGLGFFTKASETTDRLGDIPLRELVYRVIELPASMRPLVWDFGQLSKTIEETYTREIVAKHLRDRNSPIQARDKIISVVSNVLAGAQNYMRERKDECSFVSLRDVERAMRVMLWFYHNLKHFNPKKDLLNEVEGIEVAAEDVPVVMKIESINDIDYITYSLILSLAVCYRARLQERDDFDINIVRRFQHPLTPIRDHKVIHNEVDRCQQLILDEMTVEANIAKNNALKENVFMMFVCIELKIPLFVIGKPGSSKSLAKSIISNSMQGRRCPDGSILQNFKQIQIMSYQCSKLSTADGIIGVFKSCRNLQNKTGSDAFTACVVLEEVGLAEDSPLLPLKVLHPLLEDSNYGYDQIETKQTDKDDNVDELKNSVAFIGISNWALDPAKMNRGIMLSRGEPDLNELIISAEGICESASNQPEIHRSIVNRIPSLAKAYHYLTSNQVNHQDEEERTNYFGLRDFYSLIKMLVFICNERKSRLNRAILCHAVKRNFGGVSCIDTVSVFNEQVQLPEDHRDGPDSSPLGLITANLANLSRSFHGETRYLLLFTENYAALNILLLSPDMWPKQQDIRNIRVIFGSSFPCDQEYSAVCLNINRIKMYMESGKTIILLNLENLYESLYDALNQYYMVLNNQRYVDLGLGTHRMKCRIHQDFKLIVVADKETVQERFPTPLINRLEKHILAMSTVLSENDVRILQQLAGWAKRFSTIDKCQSIGFNNRDTFTEGDCFIGFHHDTPSFIVFHMMKEMYPTTCSKIDNDAVFERCITLLLRMATTDAVLRVKNSLLSNQSERIIAEYFRLHLGSLEEYLRQILTSICKHEIGAHLTLATTHSRILTGKDVDQLKQRLSTDRGKLEITSLSLQQIQTEQQYSREIQEFLRRDTEIEIVSHKKILLILCERGEANTKLIACARQKVVDELKDWKEERGESKCEIFIVFLILLKRHVHGSKFASFCGGNWNTVHIDDIRSLYSTELPPISILFGKPIWKLFEEHDQVCNVII